MKTKKLVLSIAAIALVVSTAVVGTFAAFKAADATAAVNTFTFANGIKVDLKETDPNGHIGEATASGSVESGWSYSNIVPGQDLMKEPKVSKVASFESYVFVKISGLSANVSLTKASDITDNGWVAIGSVDAYGNGTYYQTIQANDEEYKVIFSSVTIANDDDIDLANEKITIAVSATQTSGYDTVEDALHDAPAFATAA